MALGRWLFCVDDMAFEQIGASIDDAGPHFPYRFAEPYARRVAFAKYADLRTNPVFARIAAFDSVLAVSVSVSLTRCDHATLSLEFVQ